MDMTILMFLFYFIEHIMWYVWHGFWHVLNVFVGYVAGADMTPSTVY